jgi:hypothetical protein
MQEYGANFLLTDYGFELSKYLNEKYGLVENQKASAPYTHLIYKRIEK